MNMRKTLLLTLILTIALLGLTPGCEKQSPPPTGEHPTTETAPAEQPAEEAAEEAAEAVEEAVEEHPTEEAAEEVVEEAATEAAEEHPAGEHPE